MERRLERTYRFQAVQCVREVARLLWAWRRLEEAGLHPILIKGWSTARLYPDIGLRPLGDVDLSFSSEEIAAAIRVREEHPEDFIWSDFHESMPDLPDRTWDDAFARTRQVPLEGCLIRYLNAIRASFYTGTMPRNRFQVALTILRYFTFCCIPTLVTHPLRRLWARGNPGRPQLHRELGA